MPRPAARELLFGASDEPQIDVRDPFDLDPACAACRSTDLAPVGADMRKCNGCGACYGLNRATGEWTRLAALFGGGRLAKPKAGPVRRSGRGWRR